MIDVDLWIDSLRDDLEQLQSGASMERRIDIRKDAILTQNDIVELAKALSPDDPKIRDLENLIHVILIQTEWDCIDSSEAA
jgi:hypothetical protein